MGKRTTSNNFRGQITPLDAKQKAIAEEEAKLREQMARYERLIEQAPKIAKQREKARREEFIVRASTGPKSASRRFALPDSRYELNAGVPARQRRLRAERNRGRNTFFFLLLGLAVSVVWLYFTVVQQ